jgi:hypothetical protein
MFLSQIDLEDLSHSVNGNRMAGRVSLPEAPNRPSPKNDTLILHFDLDVKSLVEEGKDFSWPRPKVCPNEDCRSLRLWGHGYVIRYFTGWSYGIWLKRYRCPECRAVHTLRPKAFYKRFRYAILTILRSLLIRIYHGRWVKGIAHQLQLYWYKGFCLQASRLRNKNPPEETELRELITLRIIPATHCV